MALSINDSLYSCLFFFLTGLHFFHLTIGLLLLSLLFWSCSFSYFLIYTCPSWLFLQPFISYIWKLLNQPSFHSSGSWFYFQMIMKVEVMPRLKIFPFSCLATDSWVFTLGIACQVHIPFPSLLLGCNRQAKTFDPRLHGSQEWWKGHEALDIDWTSTSIAEVVSCPVKSSLFSHPWPGLYDWQIGVSR